MTISVLHCEYISAIYEMYVYFDFSLCRLEFNFFILLLCVYFLGFVAELKIFFINMQLVRYLFFKV